MPIAEEVATAELGRRVNAEYVVRPHIDGLADVVAPPTISVLGNRIAAASVLENISIDDRLIGGISANLDREAAGIENRVAFNDDGFARRPALPIVAAVPPILVAVHINLVGLPTIKPPTR